MAGKGSQMQISQVLPNSPIANRIKPEVLKSNSQLDKNVVDLLLQDCGDLIEVSYTAWFAKRFYVMDADNIRRCASEARQDAKDAKRLFAFLVKKRSKA